MTPWIWGFVQKEPIAALATVVGLASFIAAVIAIPKNSILLTSVAKSRPRTNGRRRNTNPLEPWKKGDVIALIGVCISFVSMVTALASLGRTANPGPLASGAPKQQSDANHPAGPSPGKDSTLGGHLIPKTSPPPTPQKPIEFLDVTVTHSQEISGADFIVDGAEPLIRQNAPRVTVLHLSRGPHRLDAEQNGKPCKPAFFDASLSASFTFDCQKLSEGTGNGK